MGVVGARGTVRERIQKRIRINRRGCWIWTAANNGKYGVLYAWGRQRYAHRVAYQEFVGPIPDGEEVRHRCDTPLCVNPMHLTTGTRRRNMRDAVERDRTAHGERCGQAKLTWEQVEEIRRRNPLTEEAVAAAGAEFGVSRRTLYRLLRGETWVGPGAPTRVPEPDWIGVVNPTTLHVARAYPDSLPRFLSTGYVRIPPHLWRAARNKLARHESGQISERSYGALARWVAERKAATA